MGLGLAFTCVNSCSARRRLLAQHTEVSNSNSQLNLDSPILLFHDHNFKYLCYSLVLAYLIFEAAPKLLYLQ
jgi:hypothetical protein